MYDQRHIRLVNIKDNPVTFTKKFWNVDGTGPFVANNRYKHYLISSDIKNKIEIVCDKLEFLREEELVVASRNGKYYEVDAKGNFTRVMTDYDAIERHSKRHYCGIYSYLYKTR